jgi:hypothetical protein
VTFAPIYLIQRFFFRVSDFFHHWYADATKILIHRFILFLRGIDQSIALRITLKYLFTPLYKDYTIVGRVVGPIFRIFRALIGIVIYAILSAIFAALFVAWLLIPPFIIFSVFRRLPIN